MRSKDILNDPLLNKGSAFTQKERDEYKLNGLLPFHVSTIDEQVQRRYGNFCEHTTPLAKFEFLNALQNRNEVLFYRLASQHIAEILPLIYTPTVGDVSIKYSSLYRDHRGIFISYPLRDKIEEIVDLLPQDEVDVIVVTDGERILGLGDLGMGGMAIPIGKLALYTLFGGIHPARTLPVLLDIGTNNEACLKDPLYLGWRNPRITGKEYDDFVDRFVKAIRKRYPKVLLQWEDFAKPHAKPLLDRYRNEICSFNDDIQGTASVVLAAILSAVKSLGTNLKSQRILVFGGGSAGMGICHHLVEALKAEGLSEAEACSRFYIVDIYGLVHTHLKGIDEAQKRFARPTAEISMWSVPDPSHITLIDTVKHMMPTVLIGVSGQRNVFTKELVHLMEQHVERPIILPLSNPTCCSEAEPQDLLLWTSGNAIIATGSPFPPANYHGRTFSIPQCNNVYIFPGVGLGVIASKATFVSDQLFIKAAQLLSDHAPILKNPQGSLFPALEDLRKVSREIGIEVGMMAIEQGKAPKISRDELIKTIDRMMWTPDY